MSTAFKQSALCAYNALTRRWAPVSTGTGSSTITSSPPWPSIPHVQPEITLATWNIDAFTPRPTTRASHILESLLGHPKVPDIIFFQEVRSNVYDSLLRDERVRSNFYATDAEDRTAFHGVPFTTCILISSTRFAPQDFEGTAERKQNKEKHQFQVGLTGRVQLPSKYARDGLFIDIHHGTDRLIRLVNVHLDSLSDTLHTRAQQMAILSRNLRENGRTRGLIAGDFNAISPEDHRIVIENGLQDQWIALHGEASNGHTWGINRREMNGLRPGRLEKVATIGLEAIEMEVLHPGTIAVSRPGESDDEKPWSDHSGLRCMFNI